MIDTQVFSGSVKRGSCWRFLGIDVNKYSMIISGQMEKYFTNLDFTQIRGPISLTKPPFGVKSCEVAII